MKNTFTTYDNQMILKCTELSARSHDPHRKVGALITDGGTTVISSGVNEPPQSFQFSVEKSQSVIIDEPQSKYYLLEHAERNAIFSALNSGRSLIGTTMYVTLYPCADCARAIAASGIARIVVPAPLVNTERDLKWVDHYKYAKAVFEFAGIRVDHHQQ